MKYRNNTKTNTNTSLLGFGCMRFPMTADNKVDINESMAMLDEAYKSGVNYYDTAYPYLEGESENILGNWLTTIDRSSVYVATKSPVWLLNSAEEFDETFEKQLSKLQTDYVDFYLLHALSKERFDKLVSQGILERLPGLKASGKVKNIGFSFHDDYEVFEEIINAYPWDFCQIQYNYLDVDEQAGDKGVSLAKEKNIPLIIMEPIKGGTLANVSDDIKEVFSEVNDYSPSAWALRFVANKPEVITILSGMSTMDQVKENIKTLSEFEGLSEEENATIKKVQDIFKSKIKVGCTSCEYCLPCPFGVNIPRNFTLYNRASVFGTLDEQRQSYAKLGEANASSCQECGVCVSKCPQHINIPEELKEVAKNLG